MSNRRFGPSSKGPRKVPSIGAYELVSESLSKCSRTARIRRQSEMVGKGDDLRIQEYKSFTQKAVSGSLKLRVEMPRKFYAEDGKIIISDTVRRFEIEQLRDEGMDRRNRVTVSKARRAATCRCKLLASKHTGMYTEHGEVKTAPSYDRRGCPVHDADAGRRKEFRRLVCRCGTSYVPQGRFQDCCQQCWNIGETPSARIFGPAANEE